MLKIGSCTVLYNPNKEVISNIASYSNDVDISVVVDNSDKKNEICDLLRLNPNVHYIDMGGNMGIAKALNVGIDYLNSNECDFALTMDQDSIFPQKYYNNIKTLVEKNSSDYSIIGLNYNKTIDDTDDTIVDVKSIITSGSFVKISDFYKVGKFKEDLFIDYVDHEYCRRINIYMGGGIGYLRGYSITHTIGNPIQKRILGINITSMNHTPIRYYYRYRNMFYLTRIDWNYYKKFFILEMFKYLPKMLLFEKQKLAKIKMVMRGLNDARKNKLGKFK